jgi:hypothetical protein
MKVRGLLSSVPGYDNPAANTERVHRPDFSSLSSCLTAVTTLCGNLHVSTRSRFLSSCVSAHYYSNTVYVVAPWRHTTPRGTGMPHGDKGGSGVSLAAWGWVEHLR